MNQNCEQFGELISGLVDGELSVPETEKVTSHLRECSDCQKLRSEFEMIDAAIQIPHQSLASPKVSLPSRRDLTNDASKPQRGFAGRQLWMPLSVTMAALLAVGISIFWPTANVGAETTDIIVPSLELDQLKDLNRESKKNTDSTLKTMELQLRIMRLNAKGLDSQDPDQLAIQTEIDQMLATLSNLKSN